MNVTICEFVDVRRAPLAPPVRPAATPLAAALLSGEWKDPRGLNTAAGDIDEKERLVQSLARLSVDEVLGLELGQLASKFDCNLPGLNRLFHRHLGFSIMALRMELRLLKAASLLLDTGSRIVEVAKTAGFNHQGVFNICFEKRFGANPAAWRKNHRRRGARPAPAGRI